MRHFVDTTNFVLKVEIQKMIDDKVPGVENLASYWSKEHRQWRLIIEDCHKMHCQDSDSPLGQLAHGLNYARGSFYQFARLFFKGQWTEPSFKFEKESSQ